MNRIYWGWFGTHILIRSSALLTKSSLHIKISFTDNLL